MNEQDLQEWVSAYVEAEDLEKGLSEHHPLWWAVEKFIESADSDPELCWSGILAVLSKEPSPKVLGNLAAGPLEDIIRYHGSEFIGRIEVEARRNPSFRHLLGGVWRGGAPDVWSRVEKARTKIW